MCRMNMQALACCGSAGQGSDLARHCMMPASRSIKPAKANIAFLCCDTHTICGRLLTKPARVAPAPIETSSAGKAQQISVPLLVNSDTQTNTKFCFSPAAGLMLVWFNSCIYFAALILSRKTSKDSSVRVIDFTT